MSIPTVRQIAANPDAASEYIVQLIGENAELLAVLRHARTCVPVPSDCHDKIVAALTKAGVA